MAEPDKKSEQSKLKEDVVETERTVSNNKKELTKEEQMALYEEDLKENDWGHRPC